MSSERIATQCICCNSSTLQKSPAVLMPFVAKRVFDHEPLLITPEFGLRDLQSGMAYSLCNSVQCPQCGVLFLDLRFSDREMGLLYNGYRGEEYTRLRERFEPGYREVSTHYTGRNPYISQIESFLAPHLAAAPAILDWGGDTGVNTPLRDVAKAVHIYDISAKATLPGTQAVDLETASKTTYDLIVCGQVLEHLPFPQNALAEMVALMREETLLYLEVPYEELMRANPGSTELYRAKHHWHEHINFFSQESLLALLAHSNLKAVATGTFEVALGRRNAWVTSVLCRRA